MIGADDSAGRAGRLAGRLDARRDEVLREYEESLSLLGNPVMRAAASREQALENAGQIFADVVASLRAGEVRIGETYRIVSWGMGVARAADGVHPSDSLQVSSVFFRTVLAAAADCLDAEPDAFVLLGTVAVALERSIMVRMRTSLSGYTSYLLNQVREAQASERRRIARDLHDRIGHCLSVTHRQLELFNLYQDTDPAKACQKVETAQQAILDSMQNLRAVTSGLYEPERLKSLDTALLNYLDGAGTEDVVVRVRVNGDESWASPDVIDEAFLVLREAARNALRHAAPSTLIIYVDITPREIRAFVEDDGCGFDPGEQPSSGGFGVSFMRERARLIGGSVSVRSRPGSGTHVDFTVPIAGPADNAAR